MTGAARRALACLVLGVLLVAGCTPDITDRIHRRTVLVFGTVIDIEVVAAPASAKTALDTVESYFERLHSDWYAFGNGELGRVNARLSNGRDAELSPELATLLDRSLSIRAASGGTFDPTIGDLVQLWGFGNEKNRRLQPPSETRIKDWLGNAAHRASIKLTDGRVVTDGPVTLDISALAKGAALEGAAGLLLEFGIENAVIDAGGDIKAIGSHPDRPWRIGIRHPRADKVLATVTMQPGEAIASSGDYQRFFESGDQRYHHVLDPRTGYPVQHTIAVTVINDDAALADAAATALMVNGPGHFLELTRALDLKYALLIDADENMLATQAMRQRLSLPDSP